MTETFAYDLLGNVIAETNPNGKVTTYTYDPNNQLIKVTNPLGEVVDYDYDKLGDLIKVKQYQGAQTFQTTKEYDERGLLISKQPPAGNPYLYLYTASGLPRQVTDPNGKVTTMQYYPDSSLSQTSANQDSVNYYYSPLGGVEKYQPSNTQTGPGESLSYVYYSTGLTWQRKVTTPGTTFTVNFGYDYNGNQTSVNDPFGLSVWYDQYDNLNRLTRVLIFADNKSFTYEYYDDGMLKAINYPPLSDHSSYIRTEYTYDNMNRLLTLVNLKGPWGNQVVISQYSYAYDNNGNITSITDNGATTNYSYDDLNRLTGIQRPNSVTINYQYDTRGNRTTTFINQASLPAVGSGQFTWNNWGELATFTASGNTYTYSYDPEGLRTKKTSPAGTTRYHYDNNGRVIAESDDITNQVTAQTIWGNSRALARKVNGQYYYYLYNGHGDVVRIINESGTTVNSYSYDEWGNILTQQEQISNPLKYAGEYYDEESGLYYLRARYYDPTIGRFISQDAIEGMITNPLSLNLYTYGYNNPLRYIDPSGHIVTEWDRAHLSDTEQREIERLTDDWWAASTAEARAAIHARAEGIRDQYRKTWERGTGDGNTVNIIVEGAKNFVVGWLEWQTSNLPEFAFDEKGWPIASQESIDKSISMLPLGGSVKIADKIKFNLQLFAGKDIKLINSIIKEYNLTTKQQELFKREIEFIKTHVGRGGSDNLSKAELRAIAKDIKANFK